MEWLLLISWTFATGGVQVIRVVVLLDDSRWLCRSFACLVILEVPMICPFPQDLDRCVTVFKAQKDDTDQPWVYVGKQRGHYKTIHGKKDSSIKHPCIVFCKYIHKGFSVSSIPHILYCKSFNRPRGAYFFQAHEIRGGKLG